MKNMELNEIIDLAKARFDDKGILIADAVYENEILTSKSAWERIYKYSIDDLKKDRRDFDDSKLIDHASYLDKAFLFTADTVYLEIGCGPAHIGEYLIKKYDVFFIGVDFNYEMLITLKKYFDESGYKKYLLICGDINAMPIRNDSIDFIYGGGVIEHFSDTNHIINESSRILKKDGVSFNTVPSLNFWWLVRIHDTIPSFPVVKGLFEFIHYKIFKGEILKKHSGYQLAFTRKELARLHKKNNFKDVSVESFAFHPSKHKINNAFLGELYFKIQKSNIFTAVYCVKGVCNK